MEKPRVIDFRVVPRTKECLGSWAPDTILPAHKKYVEMYRMHGRVTPIPLDEQVEMMRQAGIVKAVINAADIETTHGRKLPNEIIARIVNEYPEMFIGFAGADPHKGMEAVRELEDAVVNLGLRGINIGPFFHRLYANDKRYYPLYTKACELGIPATLHTSVNFDPATIMDYGNPTHLDEVACHFPELTLIASHAGWPWVLPMVAVAWRHDNVVVEISGIKPRFIHPELLKFFDNILQDRVVFGTDYPLYEFKEGVEGFLDLPLKEETKRKILYDNAARILRLSD